MKRIFPFDLARGNAQLLETLRRRFFNRPIDWEKEWGLKK